MLKKPAVVQSRTYYVNNRGDGTYAKEVVEKCVSWIPVKMILFAIIWLLIWLVIGIVIGRQHCSYELSANHDISEQGEPLSNISRSYDQLLNISRKLIHGSEVCRYVKNGTRNPVARSEACLLPIQKIHGMVPLVAAVELDEGITLCEASVINYQYLLTTASCVKGQSITSIKIAWQETPKIVNYFSINEIIPHEMFNQRGLGENDIALIVVNGSYTQTTPLFLVVPKIPFPHHKQDLSGDPCVVGVGYGHTRDQPNRQLVTCERRFLSSSDCSRFVGSTPDVICDRTFESKLETMPNQKPLLTDMNMNMTEVGGPLLAVNNGKLVLVGILSKKGTQVREAPNKSTPNVYIDMSEYGPWASYQMSRLDEEVTKSPGGKTSSNNINNGRTESTFG